MAIDHPRQVTNEEMIDAVRQLAPPGRVFNDDPNSVWNQLLAIIGESCYDFAQTAANAMDETNPNAANEMLADWLNVANAANREELIRIITDEGNTTISDMQNDLGDLNIRATEITVLRCGNAKIGDRLNKTGIFIEYTQSIFDTPAKLAELRNRVDRTRAIHIPAFYIPTTEIIAPQNPTQNPTQSPTQCLTFGDAVLTYNNKRLTYN